MENKYFAINWTDGVKITKEHFIENDAHTTNVVRDMGALGLNSYNYGILGAIEGTTSAVQLTAPTNTKERLTLCLECCNAITKKGSRIWFIPEVYGDVKPSATIESKLLETSSDLEFLVVVTVNPFIMVPVGEPDPESIPLHHPYALPKINLQIISTDQFNANYMQSNFLIVGKVNWRNGAFVIADTFIPPTTKVKYNKRLKAFQQNINTLFTQLRNYAITIHRKNHLKYPTNKLAHNTYKLCVKTIDYINEQKFYFSQLALEQPPIFMVESIALLATYLSSELDLMDPKEKENLLQYYYEWIDIKPSKLESAIGTVMDVQYNHLDIDKSFTIINRFMAMIARLWGKMAELEYIGQRKDNIVVSEQKQHIKSTNSNPSWSIID
ncbi:MAG: hypothetical protein OIF50_07090 [Flavobacteriaceae bacterium]|nr:hypothetical protein [Flavobacteriaceae bacterium]